ncbi:MAG: hydrogenase nickel incorporation protein HypA [Thermoplasmatales archaeon]|nr:MAG: hydrogenase nickel incorporation protein HypA [Thermoplasmatales archaeon]
MHEWALAEAIISAAVEAAEKEKLKTVTEIKIGIGELQQIEQDIFEFALGEIIKSHGNKLKNVKISIETERSILKCKSCEHTWNFGDAKKKLDDDEAEDIHFIPEVVFVHTRCPKCGSPDFEITTGRGISIISIKGKK